MSKVFFIKDNFFEKVEPLIRKRFRNLKEKKVALKAHMGEYGNLYYIRPAVVGRVSEIVSEMGGHPFLFDTLPKYPGSRNTVEKYEETARKHGFTEESIGCPVMILDKMKTFKGRHLELEMPEYAMDSDVLIVISHGKGHWHCAGFGGAIKNIGMGMISPKTKIEMHRQGGPKLTGKCKKCKACLESCPFDHITIDKDWSVNKNCGGCGRCIKVCPEKALSYASDTFGALLNEPVEVVSKKIPERFYITALVNITSRCDCCENPGPPLCRDIGFLVSDDPVAIDQAAIDLIKKEKPDFFEAMGLDPEEQTSAGEKYGLGSTKYELVKV
jgi:hypothetical protein